MPTRPANVTNESRAVWSAATKMLDEMQVLTVADGGQLERYCIMFVQWRRVHRAIEKMTATDDMLIATVLDKDGRGSRSVIRNLWAEYHRLNQALRQTEMQFGLTPAARARLTCMVAGEADKVQGDELADKFFCGAS